MSSGRMENKQMQYNAGVLNLIKLSILITT